LTVPHPDDGVIGARLGPYRLRAATGFGPRLVGLSRDGGPEILAELAPDVGIDRASGGRYLFRGGHRLWAAPELPEITYAPDDHPCEVVVGEDEVTITAPIDGAGLAKTVRFGIEGDSLVVTHTLANDGSGSRAVAPWAITQLPLGGEVVIPTTTIQDPGLQAAHTLSLWTYTDLSDRRVAWRQRACVIDALPGPAFKIGVGPDPGRLGYLRGGVLFLKEVPPRRGVEYADLGAVGQVYLNDTFCELESLGPITDLEPGASVTHSERWWVEPCKALGQAYKRVIG
jgi:hypothetical protein